MKRLKKVLEMDRELSWAGLVAIGLVANAWFVWSYRSAAGGSVGGDPCGPRAANAGRFGPQADPARAERRHVSPSGGGGCSDAIHQVVGSIKGGSDIRVGAFRDRESDVPTETQKTVKAHFLGTPRSDPALASKRPHAPTTTPNWITQFLQNRFIAQMDSCCVQENTR